MTTHSSILAWRIPMDREAWRATVHWVIKSWTRLKRLSTHTHAANNPFNEYSGLTRNMKKNPISKVKMTLGHNSSYTSALKCGLSFHYLLLNNMEKELSKCSYVKRFYVIKKSLVPKFNLYDLIYILPK